EVRTCRHTNALIQKRAIGHAVLHPFLAVKMKLVRIVVSVCREQGWNSIERLDTPQEIIIDQRAVSDLGTNVRRGKDLPRTLICGKYHADGDVSVRMTIWLNAGPLHTLYKSVKVRLAYGNVALVWRMSSRVGLAQGHGALGKGTIDRIFRSRSETNPRV